MKFTCTQTALNKAVNTVSKAVSSRTTIPILRGILMKVENGKLIMTCSNLDMSVESSIDVQGAEDGSLVVPARMFGEIVRRLPNAMITVSTDDRQNLSINCLGSVFSLVVMPAEDYPSVGNIVPLKEADVSRDYFNELIRKTGFAASIDEKKGILTGCLVKFMDEKIEMVALDGFRMAIANCPYDKDMRAEVVIPARILSDVSKILTESEDDILTIGLDDKKAAFTCGETKLIARLLEGEYIQYESILPKEYKTKVTISRDELSSSIERASLFSKEGKNNLIRIDVSDGSFDISSRSEEGNVNEHIMAEVEGDPLTIGFNSKYVVDALKAANDEEVVFEMTSAVTSCLIKPVEGSSYTFLVLPVRMTV
jgi:DNA polymerase-3 subunit beta